VSVLSRIIGVLARLPAARTRDVTVERDLEAKMPDGTVLLADRWYPSAHVSPPVILLRCPYGRRQVGLLGRLFAERGYQAVIQSCRGTFGSGGDWEPFRNEREDGRATLAWVAGQPWFGGSMATFGPSYLGLTQWALIDEPSPALRAIAPAVTATDFRRSVVYPGGAFALESSLTWANQVEHQEERGPRILRSMARSGAVVRRAVTTVPVGATDQRALGHRVDWFQDWLAHEERSDPWWAPVDFGHHLGDAPPATLVGGWYDIFLPWQVADYEALRASGRMARLTIGPWTHAAPAAMAAAVRDGIEWFDTHLGGRPPVREAAVRLFVMGSGRWVDLPAWPPPAEVQRWHLHAGGWLDRASPVGSPPDRYRFNPMDPTPGIGGPPLDRKNAGPKDQRHREERADVLASTSAPLVDDMTVAGPLAVDLWVRSSLQHTDFFVRLCDVSPKGRSVNLADGIVRLRPEDVGREEDGSFHVRIDMWPTAHTFRVGHRVRLQVSSGAHPLFVRNPGTGEPLATAVTFRSADQEVLHDPDHQSAIELPVSLI
jgi:putative CocE/NonD family hydrolase